MSFGGVSGTVFFVALFSCDDVATEGMLSMAGGLSTGVLVLSSGASVCRVGGVFEEYFLAMTATRQPRSKAARRSAREEWGKSMAEATAGSRGVVGRRITQGLSALSPQGDIK